MTDAGRRLLRAVTIPTAWLRSATGSPFFPSVPIAAGYFDGS